MKTTAIRTKSYGPFEVIGEVSPGDGRVFFQLPFSEVIGCRLLLSLVDNYSTVASFVGPAVASEWPGVEISVWGNVQGYESVIKRQCVHMQTGPMGMVFDFSEGWDSISFRAKNMNGGAAHLIPTLTQAEGLSLKISVYVMPRSGFATPGVDDRYGKAG